MTFALLSTGLIGYSAWIYPGGEPFASDEYILYADGDVASGIISVTPDPFDTDPDDGSCTVILTMNSKTLGEYEWGIRSLDQALYIYDDDTDAYEYTGHKMPAGSTLHDGGKTMICTLDPGHYSVTVHVNHKTYSGTFVLQGEIVRNYSWGFDPTFSSNDPIGFELEFKFQYGDCLSAAEYNGLRGIKNVQMINELVETFASENDVIDQLENQLSSLYTDKTSLAPSTDEYKYASYLLAFVQEEFDYPSAMSDGEKWGPDDLIYGKEEYWAFPTETIMQGAGDCEDTSFLCATLFRAAGYDAAVAILPGHAMAGISLPTSNPYWSTPTNKYQLFQTVTIGGVSTKYYGCETTTSSQYHIGYTSVEYDDKPLTEWVEIEIEGLPTGMNGFYPI